MAWGCAAGEGAGDGGDEGIAFLGPSGAELEHARALIDLGAAIRRAKPRRAAGKTNRPDRARAVPAMKTVAYHLTNAYRKLDVSSRDALSAALVD